MLNQSTQVGGGPPLVYANAVPADQVYVVPSAPSYPADNQGLYADQQQHQYTPQQAYPMQQGAPAYVSPAAPVYSNSPYGVPAPQQYYVNPAPRNVGVCRRCGREFVRYHYVLKIVYMS